jgi:hypothetical protein
VLQQSPANWYRDPFGRHELRYWDGGQWTHHVVTRGHQQIDSSAGGPPTTTITGANREARQDKPTADTSTSAAEGGEALFTAPTLVVAQKTKLFEVNIGYTIRDGRGRRIGSAVEVGQNLVKVLTRSPETTRAYKLHVLDATGRVRLVLTRPPTMFRSTLIVHGPHGAGIGRIVQKTLGITGKPRFSLETGKAPLGSIISEGWATSFTILDTAGTQIAQIDRETAGMSKGLVTGDDFVVRISQPLDRPLSALVVASSIAIDLALRESSGPGPRAPWSE